MTDAYFSIESTEDVVNEPDNPYALYVGFIRINSYSERFLSSSTFWKKPKYQSHWRSQVKRIVDGACSACLITSIADPTTANFIVWWPLYRIEQTIHIQNQILFLNTIEGPFDVAHPERYVRQRSTHNEDGEEISEWTTTLDAVAAFLRRSSQNSGGSLT